MQVRHPGAGLLAALFVAMVPSYISRSVAGSYDNEGVAIFALVNTFYWFVKVRVQAEQAAASVLLAVPGGTHTATQTTTSATSRPGRKARVTRYLWWTHRYRYAGCSAVISAIFSADRGSLLTVQSSLLTVVHLVSTVVVHAHVRVADMCMRMCVLLTCACC